MAWRCSGSSNEELIKNMKDNGLIKDERVYEAFLKVDRAHYTTYSPYEDSPQSIGHSATISAPHMHASACERLINYIIPPASAAAPEEQRRRILDVGSGSGYLTHVLSALAPPGSLTIGLEHIPELTELGERNVRKSEGGRRRLDSGAVKFVTGDGRKGWLEEDGKGEWDVIHVGAAAKKVHEELVEQLKAPGSMFIPVDDDKDGYSQHIWQVSKDPEGKVTSEKLFGVRYVPLTDAPKGR